MSSATASPPDLAAQIKADAETGKAKAAEAAAAKELLRLKQDGDAKAAEAAKAAARAEEQEARKAREKQERDDRAAKKAEGDAARERKAAELAAGRQRAAPAVRPKRTFPFVCAGQQVIWHHNGDVRAAPIPATVLVVGEKGIDLLTYPRGGGGMSQQDAVRFCHDPTATPAQRAESGGWDYTQADHRLHGLHPELRDWPDEQDD